MYMRSSRDEYVFVSRTHRPTSLLILFLALIFLCIPDAAAHVIAAIDECFIAQNSSRFFLNLMLW